MCLIVTIGVSLFTKPKPDAELKNLVFGLTPLPDEGPCPWYERPVVGGRGRGGPDDRSTSSSGETTNRKVPTMENEHQIPIWFFIGGILAVYGVLIFGAGLYGLHLAAGPRDWPTCTPTSGGASC